MLNLKFYLVKIIFTRLSKYTTVMKAKARTAKVYSPAPCPMMANWMIKDAKMPQPAIMSQ